MGLKAVVTKPVHVSYKTNNRAMLRALAAMRRPLGAAALSTRTALRNKNAQDIEKLNTMIRQKLAEIEQMEKKRIEDEAKPKLSDFTRPILLTLAISSTVYFTYHLVWWNLEYDERERLLQNQLEAKEAELQLALSELKPTASPKNWYKLW